MKRKYNIDLPKQKISYIVGKGPGGWIGKSHKKTAQGEDKVKRTYHKKETLSAEQSISIEDAFRDIQTGLQQIHDGYKAIFMHLRLLVIKDAGKVFNMAKEAGIEIKAEDITE